MPRPNASVVLAVLALLVSPIHPVDAAESYDNCTGFVDSLPATIASQGTWCLRKDLSTGMSSGNAIEIATNNVTLDCNDFKIGGLGAGPATRAVGIHADDRLNTTIRHCNVRGFATGIELRGSGHLVEDNTLDGNTSIGIQVYGTNAEVRGNRVLDTGGESPPGVVVYGISVGFNVFLGTENGNSVDVIDNVISGVVGGGDASSAFGIVTTSNGDGSIVGNRISGVVPFGTGNHGGINSVANGNDGAVISGNMVQGLGAGGKGIICGSSRQTAHANVVRGFATAIQGCFSASNTVSSN